MLVYLVPLVCAILTYINGDAILIPSVITAIVCFFPLMITITARNLFVTQPRGIALPEDKTVAGALILGFQMMALYYVMWVGLMVALELVPTQY